MTFLHMALSNIENLCTHKQQQSEVLMLDIYIFGFGVVTQVTVM